MTNIAEPAVPLNPVTLAYPFHPFATVTNIAEPAVPLNPVTLVFWRATASREDGPEIRALQNE